jgi:hypothetical protein
VREITATVLKCLAIHLSFHLTAPAYRLRYSKLSPQSFYYSLWLTWASRGAEHQVPYATKTSSQTLSTACVVNCPNRIASCYSNDPRSPMGQCIQRPELPLHKHLFCPLLTRFEKCVSHIGLETFLNPSRCYFFL